jgi:hypothetical protein
VARQLDSPTYDFPGWEVNRRDQLRFRVTDFKVRQVLGRWPLSVSSDLIALPTMRCIGLLARMGVGDRSGDGRVFETYPAVALHQWGFQSTGYKGKTKVYQLQTLFKRLQEKAPWLDMGEPQMRERLAANDDAFDALIAALIARAAVLGLILKASADERARARTEGWIAIPDDGSLDRLC